MLDTVAVRIPRGPARDVDGAVVRALRYACGLSLMEFGSKLGKEKVTVYRWEIGGLDEITWLGILSKLDLPASWKPPRETLSRAQGEVDELRAAKKKR